ncbi:MAG: helix-hairpin-helix domain-containing protein [Gammaproteobacteria bacterium]|jgi:competence protein ComEA|nr:helix-hairpin-helix domain-containing protein [Gammaproteobacteria bacterium]
MKIRMVLVAAMLAPVWALAGPVDLNTADAPTLAEELDGVGMARAQAIVEYREKNGQFRSVDELLNVKGIGPQVIEKNRTNLRTGEQPSGKR